MLTLAGMTGTAAVFLPVVERISPWTVIWSPVFPGPDRPFWLSGPYPLLLASALPACLAILITIGTIRWLISGSLSVPERIIAYFAGAAMLLLSLYASLVLALPFGRSASFPLSLLPLFSHVLILAPGIAVLIWCWRAGWSKQFVPVMSLQVVYVAHAAMWLIAFFGDWQLGAFFVLVAAGVFVAQSVLIMAEAARTAARTPA